LSRAGASPAGDAPAALQGCGTNRHRSLHRAHPQPAADRAADRGAAAGVAADRHHADPVQGIITRDNVSVDVSAVAYYQVVDATKSVVAIEKVAAAINQIAQTTLRNVVGQHILDQTLAETDRINKSIREILDVQTEDGGVVVTLVEFKDIQLPERRKRAMARQAEAELGTASTSWWLTRWPCSSATSKVWSRSASTRTPRWCSRPHS